ncbi:hypothetical protein [Streptomyces sp. SPB162]|uniref:hypothetical protein n=1 Tax=Streptomyces sp. SPB162 TaxID=2940560 RepID=UPI002404E472|nr:hypothetical protein [Streptomyces sp. SPB162]MDF9814262.1 hypothetical protein [Streptomyces sp. SPB162]
MVAMVRMSGRRGAALAVPAVGAVLLLAMTTAGCGAAGDDGYVAVGGVGPSQGGATGDVPPVGPVVMVPLDGPAPPGPGRPSASGEPSAPGTAQGSPGSVPGSTRTPGTAHGGSASAGNGSPGTSAPGDSGSTAPAPPGTTPGTTPPHTSPPGTTPPATPARLTVSTPKRAPAADRWCEKVTVTFTNSGGRAATSGNVTFGTHIIGGLGIDWATIETTKPVPVPLAGGASKAQTWEVCVDAWRVPLGMHVETRDVTLT